MNVKTQTKEREMRFTPTEWKIISHRLEAGDGIAECLDKHDPEEVAERAYDLMVGGQDAVDWDSLLDRDIIVDCCEGCTLFADIEDEVAVGNMSRGEALALYRAAKSIEDKLGWKVNTI